MKNIQRLVIADDLTGANDTGVHFLSDAGRVSVVIDPESDGLSRAIETIVVNTNTRLCTPDQAFTMVQQSLQKYSRWEPLEILKKVDSTLRGNIGAEIDAVMKVRDYKVACVAPASPRNGRTVRNGVCFVNGVPLDETEVARDPFSPVRYGDIRKIVSAQTTRPVGLLPLAVVQSSEEDSLRYLQELIRNGVEIVVADAESVEDLRRIRQVFMQLPESVLYVGSAGLLHAIGPASGNNGHSHPARLRSDSKILFVIGSLMETTLAQVESLRSDFPVQTCLLRTRDAVENQNKEVERLVSSVCSQFALTHCVVIQTERASSDVAAVASVVGRTLGEVVKKITGSLDIDAMVVTGGDTAQYVLKSLKVGSLDLLDEVLPGIPVSEILVPGSSHPSIFITKAGSFGEHNALSGVLDYLTQIHTAGADV